MTSNPVQIVAEPNEPQLRTVRPTQCAVLAGLREVAAAGT
jgi:hypothetical protein